MTTEQNGIPQNELRIYLGTIPVDDLRKLEQLMIDKTMSTHYIFKNWKRGITKVPLLERTVINRVSQEYNCRDVFNLENHETENQTTET